MLFSKLAEKNLIVNSKKCEFFKNIIEFLGHKIEESGTLPEKAKVQTISEWPIPTNLTEIKSFLGFTGYYQKFIRNFASLAEPLTRLLKKDVRFEWGPDQNTAFSSLKNACPTHLY